MLFNCDPSHIASFKDDDHDDDDDDGSLPILDGINVLYIFFAIRCRILSSQIVDLIDAH